MQQVNVDSMELVRPRTVGVEAAALWAMRQVDFQGLLREQGFTGPQRAAALGSIIGRMAAPGSELATHAWLSDHSGLGELLDVDFEAAGLSSLYRVSNRVWAARAPLEATLFDRVQDLFGLSTTVTLYDLTNTCFEGEMDANTSARRGRSSAGQLSTQTALSNFIGKLKGKSAHVLRTELWPQITDKLWAGRFWSPSYCAGSCGGAPREVVEQSVKDQKRPPEAQAHLAASPDRTGLTRS